MPSSNLIERTAELVASARAVMAPAVQSELDELDRRLREPVRIAVVGRVSSGKSTMVNALLGQRIAPTDVSECTRLVTWFHYGHPQRLEVERTDGTRSEVQLAPGGTLPAELGVPVETVASLHCYLANELLKWMTLLDTPGIGSVHEEYSETTEALLTIEQRSASAAARADAVVFLFNQVVMEDELRLLQRFKATSRTDGAQSAANAVGVLSKADQLGDGTRDPWGVALELAGQFAGKFRDEVATVVPVIGLIAQTAETAALTESDASHLSALAAMDPDQRERLMWSADRFISADAPVESAARERLLELLDLYGVERALSYLAETPGNAVALRRELSQLSGVAAVKRTLAKYFTEQDHVLKVRSVIETLDHLTYRADAGGPAQLSGFRAQVEALRLDPDMHAVAELEALHECHTGRVTLDPPVMAEVTRLFAAGSAATKLGMPAASPPDLVAHARDRMGWWRAFMVSEADPAQARLARVVLRSYQLIWKELS
jgi:GTPase Era involved in 16S rRNA processing